MSVWTHVAATVRVDDLDFIIKGEKKDFTKIFGKEIHFHDIWDGKLSWDEIEAHPDEYLPYGSEGSLQMKVITTPENDSSINRYNIIIYGDLRDHDEPEAIIEWFKEKLKGLWVRQACITVANSVKDTLTWSTDGGEEAEGDEDEES